MMDYEMFKTEVAEHFLEYMPDDFKGYTVKICQICKVNRTVDELSLIDQKIKGRQCNPAIYMNDMYDAYCINDDMMRTLAAAATLLVEAYEKLPKNLRDLYGEGPYDRDNIVMRLVNTARNQELLQDCPNRPLNDLSIIYVAVVLVDDDLLQSAIITNELAENLGMDEPTLYKVTMENTRRLFPPQIMPITEMIGELNAVSFAGCGAISQEPNDAQEVLPLYVITNERKQFGAVSILYKDKMDALAWKLGADLLLLPSSLHEMIAMPANCESMPLNRGRIGALETLVHMVNQTEIRPEDWLSDSVYYYDRKSGEVMTAMDALDKAAASAEEQAARREGKVPAFGFQPG